MSIYCDRINAAKTDRVVTLTDGGKKKKTSAVEDERRRCGQGIALYLERHRQAYYQVEEEDLVKFVFQAMLGPGT